MVDLLLIRFRRINYSTVNSYVMNLLVYNSVRLQLANSKGKCCTSIANLSKKQQQKQPSKLFYKQLCSRQNSQKTPMPESPL